MNATHSRPQIRATVRFLPSDEGGRKGPTPDAMFGCLFEFDGRTFDGWLMLDEVGAVLPGATVTAPVVFLRPELILPRLHPGSRFTLREIGTIAEGVVDAVVQERAGDR